MSQPPSSTENNPKSLKFEAMHCPCEVLLDTHDDRVAAEQREAAVQEANRIEQKFSRYIKGNVMDAINSSQGKPITVDDETAALLDYAAQCYGMSDGLFDITTGVLRKVWRFKGEEHDVDTTALEHAKRHMGWNRVSWKRPVLQLPEGFEIDFGGICKEYASDKILSLLRSRHPMATLVNMGGDIVANGERAWSVGIEDPRKPGKMVHTVYLKKGAVATSGTTKRFTRVGKKVLGHILNPKTGWPVENPPLSVTVAAHTCTEAGFLTTLAMLHGANAETFLKEQQVESWCYR